jgi:hypothetical protein
VELTRHDEKLGKFTAGAGGRFAGLLSLKAIDRRLGKSNILGKRVSK